MARNRKRAKERRSRRPQPAVSRPGVATARAERADGAPDPIEHATPDVELADAQLAVGRAELVDEAEPEDEFDELEPDIAPASEVDDDARSPDAALAVPSAHVPEGKTRAGNRLLNFLQGSWRELQRVQWPDRRQVIQATGVVIGFVIVAGVFLGVADTLAGKLMNFVLK